MSEEGPVTLATLRAKTTAWFEQLGIPTPRLDAELLIAHSVGVDRMAFYTDGHRPLDEAQVTACREAVRRRGRREPIAYILGRREFWSRDFKVDARVLIPRPDSETLVALCLSWLDPARGAPTRRNGLGRPDAQGGGQDDEGRGDSAGLRAHDEGGGRMERRELGIEATVSYDAEGDGTERAVPPGNPDAAERDGGWREAAKQEDDGVVLDYGTGSGALAITLLCERLGLRGLALDISRDALAVARENAAAHGVVDRLGFVVSDGLSRVPDRFRGCLRGIVANPPYLPLSDRASLAPDVRDHEPAQALFAGEDPLSHYRRLALQGAEWLAPEGFLALEVGAGQSVEVRRLLEVAGWRELDTRRDLAGIERAIAARRPA